MIHLVGLPHTSFDEDTYSACAFTAKAVRWTRVLERIDQAVTVYWGGGPVKGTSAEVVACLSEAERLDWFGEDVATRLPDIVWNAEVPYWSTFLTNAIREVRARIQPGDLVAIWAGSVMQQVVDAFPDHSVIEPAVGYGGLADGTFACFESYAWMHNRYGALGIDDGRPFDAVIPNFIEPDDFTTGADGGYALFLGRLISRKGPHVAADIAARASVPLVLAGAGFREWEGDDGRMVTEDGTVVQGATDGAISYAGVVGPTARRELLAHASVLIVPTLYIEPFGTVHVEALASGVPVIASDWGVFTETVEQGVDGYRFRTPAQAAEQVHDAAALRGPALRTRTLDRFSLDAVAPRFDEWLWRVRSVRNGLDGWNAPTYLREEVPA
jgi:glycosyltransferase involved in cell wall biosynthesis